MFKKDIVQNVWNGMVLPVFCLAVDLILFFAVPQFMGKMVIIILSTIVGLVALINLVMLLAILPIVFRNSDVTISTLTQKHIGLYVREVKQRLDKGNSGYGQKQKLAEFCAILLSNKICDIDQLETFLKKSIDLPISLTYKTEYTYIPSTDETDQRKGVLQLSIDNAYVEVSIW